MIRGFFDVALICNTADNKFNKIAMYDICCYSITKDTLKELIGCISNKCPDNISDDSETTANNNTNYTSDDIVEDTDDNKKVEEDDKDTSDMDDHNADEAIDSEDKKEEKGDKKLKDTDFQCWDHHTKKHIQWDYNDVDQTGTSYMSCKTSPSINNTLEIE
eukprot:1975283-Ditylum_brightwellii.AAC.1